MVNELVTGLGGLGFNIGWIEHVILTSHLLVLRSVTQYHLEL